MNNSYVATALWVGVFPIGVRVGDMGKITLGEFSAIGRPDVLLTATSATESRIGSAMAKGAALLVRSFGWLPIHDSYWSMLYGGHALVAIKRGYIRYLFTVWRKAA